MARHSILKTMEEAKEDIVDDSANMPRIRQQEPPRSQHAQPPEPQLSPPVPQNEIRKLTSQQAKAELHRAIKGTKSVLAEIRTPLLLFPVTLTLDRAKISAAKFPLFGSKGIMSLPMADVLNVTAEQGMLLGKVKVDKRVLSKEEAYKIGPFWRKDALRFATLAQGYVMALERSIDLTALSIKELRNLLFQLGTDENVDYSHAKPTKP